MRAYLDTSVLVAAHTREPHTELAQAWLMSVSGELLLTPWTLLECTSALAIKLRRGELDASAQQAAGADIDAFAASCAPLAAVLPEDYERARLLCREAASGLRAGDALHLAAALRLKATHLATLDHTLARNAAAKGMMLAIQLPVTLTGQP